ncbi:hypothetical protein [Desulfosarcina ovata]|uniref:Uncharacterized protein n=1 Tax=Desulfosarcina ovata subsp. ovata TaxID=2752305 RepID=A0A5K8AAS7_9BACT|nr:hypothetical protein [Desulfosarcina ovata]BBO89619.1 hypothetical protein DSCOOX_27990 [Desulfosarcina ovata subsp. ovata]
MEYSQMTKRVIDFQKMSFDNWYNAVTSLQNQAVSMMDTVLDQSRWLPDDGRKAIQRWIHLCEQEGGRFKTYVDDGFTGIEKYISESKTTAPTKTKTTE